MSASWSHRLVRPLVPLLLRMKVRPNHVTTAHLVVGAGTLVTIAFGSDHARVWAGIAWLFSCLLDRLDGELARIGGMCSAAGHHYDYLVDMWLTALFFLAMGLSVHGPQHMIATACGAAAFLCQLVSGQVAERYDRLSGAAGKVLGSRWGFDADDALYILGPLGWLPNPLRLAVAILSAGGTAIFLGLFLYRYARLKAERRAMVAQ